MVHSNELLPKFFESTHEAGKQWQDDVCPLTRKRHGLTALVNMSNADTADRFPPLSTVPQSVLESLYAKQGDSLLKDKLLCRALLADNCGLFRTENFVLASVAREGLLGVADALFPTPQARVDALARRIEQQLGFRRDVAQWAASSWANALQWLAIKTAQQKVTPIASHRRTARSRNASTDNLDDCDEHSDTTLLQSVLLAFRSVLEGCYICPTVGFVEDESGILPPCDAAVGLIRLRGFSPQQRTLVFCEQGMHTVGFDVASRRGDFLHYLDLQKAPVCMSGPHMLTMGTPDFQMDLRHAAVRCRDVALLITTVREVVAMSWRSGDSRQPLTSNLL